MGEQPAATPDPTEMAQMSLALIDLAGAAIAFAHFGDDADCHLADIEGLGRLTWHLARRLADAAGRMELQSARDADPRADP